mgnify:CR=1 FL=1
MIAKAEVPERAAVDMRLVLASFIAVCTVYISLNRSLVLSFASGS